MNFDEIRKQTLSNAGEDDRVGVNQKDLIDKILARYSAEFVVYRELMQNSGATSVQIHFYTLNKQEGVSYSQLLQDKVNRIVFKNNGKPFRGEDWKRLKTIAEGNPDESKIGAFGVGFYSLFSICEEPFVISGDESMAFYWKGNGLFARKATNSPPTAVSPTTTTPEATTTPTATVPAKTDDTIWTTFLMDLREPDDVPNYQQFSSFLVRSLCFTANLKTVQMLVNDRLMFSVEKSFHPLPTIQSSSLSASISKSISEISAINLAKQEAATNTTSKSSFNFFKTKNNIHNTSNAPSMPAVSSSTSISYPYRSTNSIFRTQSLQLNSIRLHIQQLNESVYNPPKKAPAPTTSSSSISEPSSTSIFSFGQGLGVASALASLSTSFFSKSSSKPKKEAVIEEIKKVDVEPATPSIATLENLTLHLRVAILNLFVTPDDHMITDMERSTKKRPPSNTSIQMIYSSKSDLDKSGWGLNLYSKHPIVASLFPYPGEGEGRIFIGFATHQTTGFSSHIAGRFVPTVERESIDFMDKTLCKWNQDLLGMSGILARILYEAEISNLSVLSLTPSLSSPTELEDGFIFTLNSFRVRQDSTPSPAVGRTIQYYFFEEFPYLPVLAVSGDGKSAPRFLPLNLVRIPPGESEASKHLALVLRNTPVLPARVATECRDAFKEFRERNLVREVDGKDVLDELRMEPFDADRVLHLFRWIIAVVQMQSNKGAEKKKKKKESSALSSFYSVLSEDTDSEVEYKKPETPSVTITRDFISEMKKLLKIDVFTVPIELAHTVQTSNHPPSSSVAPATSKSVPVTPTPTPSTPTPSTLTTVPSKPVIAHLSQLKYVLNPKVIPTDVPIPTSVVPYSITKQFNKEELELLSKVFVWSELPLLEWCSYVAALPQLEIDGEFSEKILGVVSRNLGGVASKTSKKKEDLTNREDDPLYAIFAPKACILTRNGMKRPSEAYFQNVTLFPDLSIVSFHKKVVSDQLLDRLGVRRHVELQMIFERLIKAGDWDHMKLVEYLSSVESMLTASEITRLSSTPIFPKATSMHHNKEHPEPSTTAPTPNATVTTTPNTASTPTTRGPLYRACDLYVPNVSLFNIGLPVIEWKKWKQGSDEERLLLRLGLRKNPMAEEVLRMASPSYTPKPEEREKALQYFLEHLVPNHKGSSSHAAYASSYDGKKSPYKDIDFLPVQPNKENVLTKTTQECFVDSSSATMNFYVLRDDLKMYGNMLGVREHPPSSKLVERLTVAPPKDKSEAVHVFSYLANRHAEFVKDDWKKVEKLRFIPYAMPDGRYTLLSPSQCFFSQPAAERSASALGDLEYFSYVDFGPVANLFLRSAGVRDEPSPAELAGLIVANPLQFFQSLHKRAVGTEVKGTPQDDGMVLQGANSVSVERYLSVLRILATNFSTLKSVTARMEDAPFLLAIKKVYGAATPATDQDEEDEGGVTIEYRLAKAKNIFLIDQTMYQQMFSTLSAPIGDSILESFYGVLGSRWISSQVQESFQITGKVDEANPRALRVKKLVMERAPLLLYEQPKESLRHDVKWLYADNGANLSFGHVQGIKLQRRFEPTGATHVEATTACAVSRLQFFEDSPKGSQLLLTAGSDGAGEIDFFDIAYSLSKVFLKRGKLNDSFLWANLLSASIPSLKQKGFPVERIRAQTRQSTAPPPTAVASIAPITGSANYYTPPKRTSSQNLQGKTPRDHNALMDKMVEESLSSLPANLGSGSPSEATSSAIKEGKKETARSEGSDKPALEKRKSGFLSKFFSNSKGEKSSKNRRDTLDGSMPPPILQPDDPPEASNKREGDYVPLMGSQLQNSLRQAIKSCRANAKGSDGIAEPIETSDSVKRVASTFCDVVPGHQLEYTCHIGVMEFYVDKKFEATKILQQHGDSLKRFELLLRFEAGVFNIPPDALHLYYDEGQTVAFNRNNSLFFNLFYFVTLNHDWDSTNDPNPKSESIVYYFMTMSHELAHAFVSAHNVEHEFYFASFAREYLPELMKRMR